MGWARASTANRQGRVPGVRKRRSKFDARDVALRSRCGSGIIKRMKIRSKMWKHRAGLAIVSWLVLGCTVTVREDKDPAKQTQRQPNEPQPEAGMKSPSPMPRPSPVPEAVAPQPEEPRPDLDAPPDAETTATGLKTKILRAGRGMAHPNMSDRIKISISSWDRETGRLLGSTGKPTLTSMSQIQREAGLWQTLKLMLEGEKRRAWIPKELTYELSHDVVIDIELVQLLPSVVTETPRLHQRPRLVPTAPQTSESAGSTGSTQGARSNHATPDVDRRIALASSPASNGLGHAASAQTAKLPEFGARLLATRKGLGGTASSQAASGGKVYATLLPRWKSGDRSIRVLEPKAAPRPVRRGVPGLGFHASENTIGGGATVGGSAGGVAGSGESLLVWDDSGNIGLADAWSWGGAGSLLGLQGGVVFQFTTASTIFDLRGTTPQAGVSAGVFGANYLQGRNADGSSYWGLELVIGPGAGLPSWPASIPSFSGQSSTTTVVGLDDFFWDVTDGMNQMFGFQSPSF